MKRFYSIPILLFTATLFACASGHSLKKKPEHIISGIKEIKNGTAWYKRGCYKRSLEHFFRAHELFAASDELSGVAMSMNNIGNVYRIMNDINNALLFFEESFDIYTDIKDHEGMAQALSNKAAALIDDGRIEEATDALSKVEDIIQKREMVFVPFLNNQGILLIKKGQYKRAEEVLKKALANTDSSKLLEFAGINFALGKLMLETKHYKKAVDYFEAALTADRTSGFHKGIADDLAAIGSAWLSQGEDGLAVKYFKRSVKIYAIIEDKEKVDKIMNRLDKASKKTDSNISITKHFVKTWIEGKVFESPCK